MCDCGKPSPDEANASHGQQAVAATAAQKTHGHSVEAAQDAATEASCACGPATAPGHHETHAGVATHA